MLGGEASQVTSAATSPAVTIRPMAMQVFHADLLPGGHARQVVEERYLGGSGAAF